MAEGVTARQRINNDHQKSHNITDKTTKHQCACLRHHVCSTSLCTAAVFCNPMGQSQSIPHREMAHQRPDHASPRRHWVRLPSCCNSEISTPLNLPLFPSHPSHSSSLVCAAYSKWKSHLACCQTGVEYDTAGAYQHASVYAQFKYKWVCVFHSYQRLNVAQNEEGN